MTTSQCRCPDPNHHSRIEFPVQICPITEVHPAHLIAGSWRDRCPGVIPPLAFTVGDLVSTPFGDGVVVFADDSISEINVQYRVALLPATARLAARQLEAHWFLADELSPSSRSAP